MSEELVSANDIRGTEETGLTVECAWNVGKALADWLPTVGNIAVVCQPPQAHLGEAVVEGIRLQGRDVVDGGSGDREAVKTYITNGGLSGGVVVGYDDAEKKTTIELYRENAKLIDSETGLQEICELVKAGNFVPAAAKGQLLHMA